MAAPSSWGNTVSDYGKIGISVNVTYPTATTASVSIEVWVATRYAATDSNNNFWFDDNAQSASTSRGSRSIKTTVNSPGWSASNQQKIYTYPTFTVQRTTGNQTRHCAAKLSGVEIAPGTMTQSVSYTIKARDSYVISYSSNDRVCTVPASHKKYHGINTTVSSTVPTTTGYTCTGWITSAPEYKFYAFGAQYTADASVTLYANWVLNKYKITLRPNGGSIVMPDTGGTVTAETVEHEKEHGSAIKLPVPTLTNYNFLGWSTSATENSVTYAPGASYMTDAPVTLYAVWELAHIPPIISNVVVERCDAEGTHADDGTYFDVSFDWATDEAREAMGHAVYIKAYDKDSVLVVEQTFNLSDFYTFIGHFSLSDFNLKALGGGYIDNEYSYTVTITVMDSSDITSTVQRTLMSVAYPIDIYKEGKGVAFGKPASREGAFDINFDAVFNKSIEFGAAAKKVLLDMFYPVDSIYISYSHTDPGTLFGGTWVRIQDRFLLGARDDMDYIGNEGGEATHVLTDAEMPTHQHELLNYNTSGYSTAEWTKSSAQIGDTKVGYTGNLSTTFTGGGQAHNNMPPYVVVSIWRRTA